MNKQKILHLFSGGKDSFLAACKLLENNENILYLVTYDNGCGLKNENVKHGVDRLVKKYGQDRVVFLGVYNTSGIWREFFIPFLNYKPSEILDNFGEITYSQFNCLTCRSSMYMYSIAICKKLKINIISEGARHDQGFVIELDSMLEEFKKMLNKYDIELTLPVIDMTSDWKTKNDLLSHGFVPKTLEPQCLLGVPLPNGIAPDDDIIQGTLSFFKNIILPKSEKLVIDLEKTINDTGCELL